jgi:glycosyltransferase involved in cell wall biosynthesis
LRIALDATYSLGTKLSGVGVYSREILNGLAATDAAEKFEWFYRSQRFWRALRCPMPPRVTRRLLTDTWGSRGADLFHGLNQRLPKRGFRKQVATFHDLFVLSGNYSTREFRERFAVQAREAAAGAGLIITVSAFTAGQVEQFLGVARARIRVIHHGVAARAIPNLPREKVVLCVGAIQRRKNQARLVRAFAAMPAEWTLVLAGAEGFESGETREAIAAGRCAARIRVTGYISDDELSLWYGRASIFAFPSLDEGFGMPVLEAMAAEVPVIAGNRSALPEVCGDAAMLVDPENEEELAAALATLANDEQRRNELVSKGRRQVSKYSWKQAVAETVKVYRELA